MKRMKLWLCCGLLLALLGGCGDDAKTPDGSGQGQSPEQNISGAGVENGGDQENADTPEINVPEVHYEPLPEHWESVDLLGVLWHVPNPEIEDKEPHGIFQIGGYPYIYRKNASESQFVKMNFSDGTILQKTTVELSWRSLEQSLENGIVVYDKDEGNVVVLNSDLEEIAKYQTKASRGDWYFGKDGSVLYDFRKDGNLVKVDLPTGNQETLLKNMEDWHTIGMNETYVNFYYTDTLEQITKYYSLNRQTGVLDEIPFEEDVAYLYREGEIWLGGSHLVEERYVICKENDEMYEIASDKYVDYMDFRKMYLMSEPNYLLTIAEDGTKILLHDYDGKFISECKMPEGYRVNFDLYKRSDNCFIWDEVYGGCYFVGYEASEDDTLYTGTSAVLEDRLGQKVFFWDVQADVSANDLQLKSYDVENPVGITVSSVLYEKAEQLSKKYGLHIQIADKANSKFESYVGLHGKPVMEENMILAGLDLIDTVLQEYKIGNVKEGTKYYRVDIHLLKDLNVISRYSDAMVSKTDISKIDCYWDTDGNGTGTLFIDLETMTADDFREKLESIGLIK